MSKSGLTLDTTNLLQYYAITVVFFIITAVLASYGNIYTFLFGYFWDFAFFVLFLCLGYILTTKVCVLSQEGKKLQALGWTFLYFFFTFVIFSDGHGSVQHSEGLWEKLLLIPVTFYLFAKSVFLPLIFLGTAVFHNVLMYIICQPCRSPEYQQFFNTANFFLYYSWQLLFTAYLTR